MARFPCTTLLAIKWKTQLSPRRESKGPGAQELCPTMAGKWMCVSAATIFLHNEQNSEEVVHQPINSGIIQGCSCKGGSQFSSKVAKMTE